MPDCRHLPNSLDSELATLCIDKIPWVDGIRCTLESQVLVVLLMPVG